MLKQYMFMTGVKALIFFVLIFILWQIDVSVGAISVNGCVFQDNQCIDPLEYYEQQVNAMWIFFIGLFAYTFWMESEIIDFFTKRKKKQKNK